MYKILARLVRNPFLEKRVEKNKKFLFRQRSPVVVTLLPTARDQSAWLFSRRNGQDDQYVK